MKAKRIAITTSLFIVSQLAIGSPDNLLNEKQHNSSDPFGQPLIQSGDSGGVFSGLQTPDSQARKNSRKNHLEVLKLLKNEQLEEAEKEINRLMQESPEDSRVYTLRATLEVLQKKTNLAIKSYQKAIELDPKNLSSHLGLASVFFQTGDYSKAKKYANSALSINDKSSYAYILLAKIAYKDNNHQELESILLTAHQKTRGNKQQEIIIAKYLAKLYASKKQPKKALSIAHETINHYPDDSAALSLLANALILNKQPEKAIQTLEKLIHQEPRDVTHRLLLARLLVNQPGKQQQVLKLLDEANSLAPKNTQVQVNRTILLVQLKLYPDALRTAQKVKQLTPDTGLAEALEGKIYLADNKQDQALAAFLKSYAIKPNIKTQNAITSILLAQGKQSAAINFLNQELQKNPKNLAAHFNLGNIYLQQKNISKAEQHFQAILTQQPENVIVLNNLAWIYHQQNNPKALMLAKRAYQKAPQSAAVADTYAMILIKQGSQTEGLKVLKKAAELEPQNYEIQYHLADAYALSGQEKKAIQILKTIISSEQNFPEKEAATSLLKKLVKDQH